MLAKYKELTTTRAFGVELEVSSAISKRAIGDLVEIFESRNNSYRPVAVTDGKKGWAESRSNKYWHIKYDATCGQLGKPLDHGWEIASFVAEGNSDLNDICKLVSFLDDCGIEPTKNCGFHIHVNVKDFTPSKIALMMARWIKIEEYLYLACDPRRRRNRYCLPLRNKFDRVGDCYDPKNLSDFFFSMAPANFRIHNNPEKKYALNIFGYVVSRIRDWYSRPTVELRIPECRMDSEYVRNWINLFLNFVDSCDCDTDPPKDLGTSQSIEETLKILGLQGKDEFFILGDGLLQAEKWLLNKLSESKKSVSGQASQRLAFISEV